MFARQIAVMKGQAWNVVETLKDPEHGPLELTRRARVCVWDDLVDIPVVIALRESSDERRFRESKDMGRANQDESGDISGAYSSLQSHQPRSSVPLASPTEDIPSSKRFNSSRQASAEDTNLAETGNRAVELSPVGRADSRQGLKIDMKSAETLESERPSTQRSKTARVSYDIPRNHSYWHSESSRRRNLSFTARRLSVGEDSEGDGDLGFAAARDMEGNRKKVIVERLETIKANPFFTWC